jgi:hypothetical protein
MLLERAQRTGVLFMIGIALFMIVPPLVLVAIPTVLYLTIPKRKSPVTLGFILAGIHLALVLYVAAPADSAGIGSESFGRSEAIPSRKSERTPGPIPNPVLNGGPLRDLWAKTIPGDERTRSNHRFLLLSRKPERNRAFE